MPGVIWWDFDATLVSRPMMWGEVALRLLDETAQPHRVTRGQMDALVSEGMPWHRTDNAHPDLASPDAWWDAVNARYRDIFAHLGHAAAAIPEALSRLRADILTASRYRVFDDVVPALERAAAAGWRSMIVSNHIPELEMLAADLGLARHFDAIVSSGVVGYEKPHRRLFEAAHRHVNPGETVWMIGDNPDADCRPVCAMGLNAVLVRHPHPGAFERQAPDLLTALDYVL